jgi:hypothetical protein
MRRILALILAIAGFPFTAVGLYELYAAREDVRGLAPARGRVIGNAYLMVTNEGQTSGAYHPIVAFEDGGERRSFTDGVGSLPPDYEVGAEVEVLYDPDDPKAARIDSFKRVWFVPIFISLLGLLPLLAYLAWLGLDALRQRPEKA